MKTNLKTILNTGSYKYCYENGKFTFYDNRIGDITKEITILVCFLLLGRNISSY